MQLEDLSSQLNNVNSENAARVAICYEELLDFWWKGLLSEVKGAILQPENHTKSMPHCVMCAKDGCAP
eukprot:13768783-Ditylum_brightwellii.AAC.1